MNNLIQFFKLNNQFNFTPLKENSKLPHGMWTKYINTKFKDFETVQENNYNLGIIATNEILIIDVDDKNLLYYIQKELENENIYTLTTNTKRGGHLYFKCKNYHFKTTKKIKIDIKQNGCGYVVSPYNVVDKHEYKIISNTQEIQEITDKNIKSFKNIFNEIIEITDKREEQKRAIREENRRAVISHIEDEKRISHNGWHRLTRDCTTRGIKLPNYMQPSETRSEQDQKLIFELTNKGYNKEGIKTIFNGFSYAKSKPNEKGERERDKYINVSFENARKERDKRAITKQQYIEKLQDHKNMIGVGINIEDDYNRYNTNEILKAIIKIYEENGHTDNFFKIDEIREITGQTKYRISKILKLLIELKIVIKGIYKINGIFKINIEKILRMIAEATKEIFKKVTFEKILKPIQRQLEEQQQRQRATSQDTS